MCGGAGKRGAGIADQQLSEDQIEKSPCPKTASRPLKETQEMHASQNVKKPAQLVPRKRHAAVSLCCASVPARGGKSRFARLGERAKRTRALRQPLAPPVQSAEIEFARDASARHAAAGIAYVDGKTRTSAKRSYMPRRA